MKAEPVEAVEAVRLEHQACNQMSAGSVFNSHRKD